MRRPLRRPGRVQRGAVVLSLLVSALTACSAEEEPPPASGNTPAAAALPDDAYPLPTEVVVADPAHPLALMDMVEDYSEAVANRMLGFSDKLRRKDFAGAAEWLTPDFAGHGLDGLETQSEGPLGLGTTARAFDPTSAPVVGRSGFLDSIAVRLAPWENVESVLWKVKGAEFETGLPPWGKVRFLLTVLGRGEDGGPRSIVAWGWGRVQEKAGQWNLAAFELTSLSITERAAALFTDVTTAVGLAHTGLRFGQPGNDSFAWQGAAAGDVNGDGAMDLFVPSRPRNFLYIALPDGGWKDEAAARGVSMPAGGTGAVFFDFDNDGDQDLAVGHSGWTEPSGARGGNRLQLYVNDGEGTFVERGAELGFDARCHAETLVVLDVDNDGYLDVFVCNYGRVKSEPNNSWTDATNGTPNLLYKNEGGEKFTDATQAAGLGDTRWTYAAAAADFDEDGDMDLYLAHDYARNELRRNRGDGTFEDAAAECGVEDLGNGMGCAWGDLDSDGHLDLYVANMSSTAGNRILKRLKKKEGAWADLSKMAAGNTVFLAGADGTFQRLPATAGGIGGSWAWSPALVDLDLDGRLDVYNANGFVTGDTAADT